MTSPDAVSPESTLSMSDVFDKEFMEKVFPETPSSDASMGTSADLPQWLNDPPPLDPNPLIMEAGGNLISEFIEVEAEPEYPGLPYRDHIFGGLNLGPDYPALQNRWRKLNPDDPNRKVVEQEIVSLYVKAEKVNAWYDGPLNERKTKKIPYPNYKKPQPSQENNPNDPDNKGGNQKDDDTDKPEPKPKAAEEPKQPEAKKSWLKTLEEKFAKTWLGKKNKDFIEYVNRHKDESKHLAWLGGLAGGASAAAGLAAAEWALAMAYPPLGIAISGIAVGLAINTAFTGLFNELYNKPKAEDALAAYNPEQHGDPKDYKEKVELDRNGRMKAFVIADIVGKFAGSLGIGLSHWYGHALTPDSGSRGVDTHPSNDFLSHADKSDAMQNYHVTPNPPPSETPLPPHLDLIPNNYKDLTDAQLLEHFRRFLGGNNWQNLGPFKDYTGRPVELADVLVRTVSANRDGISPNELEAIRQVATTHNLVDLIKLINQGVYNTIFNSTGQ